MKIERIETFPLYYPLKHPYGDANGYKRYRACYLFRITTSSGYSGWGECIDWLPTLDIGFKERIIPYLLGKQATDRLSLVKTISKWHKRIATGVSMALTEIIAQHAKLSICDLWGGQLHEQIPVYASFQSYSGGNNWIEKSVAMVEKEVMKGFTKCKVKIGGKPLTEDQKHIKLLQERIDNKIQLILDANQSYNLAATRQWEKLFAQSSNLLWLEEPMSLDYVKEYKQLRTSISIPLAGGENLMSTTAFLSYITEHALDILQPDINHFEGIDDYRITLQLARSSGNCVSSHTFDGALSRLYTLFAHACLPSWSKMEGEDMEPIEWDVMENPFTELISLKPVKSTIKIPTTTGIGLELDMSLLKKYHWDGSTYH